MNEKKLKIKMIEAEVTAKDLATDLQQTRQSIYNKLTGKTDFSLKEIKFLKEKLNLTDDDFLDIFIRD